MSRICFQHASMIAQDSDSEKDNVTFWLIKFHAMTNVLIWSMYPVMLFLVSLFPALCASLQPHSYQCLLRFPSGFIYN